MSRETPEREGGEQAPPKAERFVPTATAVAAFRGAAPVDYDRLRADLDNASTDHASESG